MIGWINKKRNKEGFTLIELVVVIAILGILAALAIPRLAGSRDSANRKSILADLRTIESAIAIAQAEDRDGVLTDDTGALLSKDSGEGFYGLVPGYLAAEPKGPSNEVYTIELDSTIVDETTVEGTGLRAYVTLTKTYGSSEIEAEKVSIDDLLAPSSDW